MKLKSQTKLPQKEDDQEKALSVLNLTRIFHNKRGAKNVSFNVGKNAFHVLIGENGAGKTTIIRSILGLYQEFSGEIKINGIDNFNTNAFNGLSYISEHATFPSPGSVNEYLYWVGAMCGYKRNKIKALVDSYLAKFNLLDIGRTNPNNLSSGQKNKIMLIKALIEKPTLLIMDEPTANLDPTARDVFYKEIREMRKNGTTIFMCTHVLPEVQKFTTEVTIISKGEVVFTGPKTKKMSLQKMFEKYINDSEVK